MRLTDTQKDILSITDAKCRMTAGDLANELDSKPGPISRAAGSLVDKGFLRMATTKDGATVYTRTAQGGKIVKTFA